ncbi:hypothetical protein FIU94_12830 [Sulfitobacter sp. THAF37]|nr:hypothetical protein FIU94_12830 [Sulfitobacter sp. THAF37]
MGARTTEPMTVTVTVTTTPEKRSGSGEAVLPQDVFDEIEAVEGAGSVEAPQGTFSIMVRKAFKDTRRVEFVTSGPVPDA